MNTHLKSLILKSAFFVFWQIPFFAYGFIYEGFFDLPSGEDSVVWVGNYEKMDLDPKSIKIMSWNVGKGKKSALVKCDSSKCDYKKAYLWEEYLSQVSSDYDLIILQETPPFARLSVYLSNQWEGYGMAMAVSYVSLRKNRRYGNAVISRAVPFMFDFKRSKVPDYFFAPPKLVTFSKFGLKGMKETLLVVNIHALNLAMEGYRRQLLVTQGVLEFHQGPVIFAGDFNAWGSRIEFVRSYMDSMGLTEVVFGNGAEKEYRLWGLLPLGHLDHVFVRGLDVQEAQVLGWQKLNCKELGCKVSDHKPLSVHLSLCATLMHEDCLLAKAAYNASKTKVDKEN